MEIDVMEHLTPSKMEEIVEDELRAIIRRFFNEYDVKEIDTNLKRIITNVSYDIVAKREEKGLSEIEEEFLTHKAKRLREIQTLLDNAKKELHEIINSIKREA
jgi:hypothetical protein